MCIVLQTRSDLTDVNIAFFIHKLVASCSTMLLLSSHHLLQPTDFAGGQAKKLSHLMLPSQPLHSTTLQSGAVTGVGGPFQEPAKAALGTHPRGAKDILVPLPFSVHDGTTAPTSQLGLVWKTEGFPPVTTLLNLRFNGIMRSGENTVLVWTSIS